MKDLLWQGIKMVLSAAALVALLLWLGNKAFGATVVGVPSMDNRSASDAP